MWPILVLYFFGNCIFVPQFGQTNERKTKLPDFLPNNIIAFQSFPIFCRRLSSGDELFPAVLEIPFKPLDFTPAGAWMGSELTEN